jgi:predicted membrane protein
MKRNYLWGIIFICLALASAAYAFGIYIDSNIAELIVSIGLILMIIVSLPRKNFFMTFILLAILIVLNRNALGFYNISIGSLFVAAILFAIGFNILFGNNRQYINSTHYGSYRKRERREVEQAPATNDKHIYEHADTEHIYNYTNRFGESTKFIQGDDLKVVNLTSDFGQLSVYFDKADFNEDGATVYCGASFGAMTLYIPRKYNVDDQLTTTLGNIKTNITDIIEEDTDIITLTLKGNVTLGEIQIIRI